MAVFRALFACFKVAASSFARHEDGASCLVNMLVALRRPTLVRKIVRHSVRKRGVCQDFELSSPAVTLPSAGERKLADLPRPPYRTGPVFLTARRSARIATGAVRSVVAGMPVTFRWWLACPRGRCTGDGHLVVGGEFEDRQEHEVAESSANRAWSLVVVDAGGPFDDLLDPSPPLGHVKNRTPFRGREGRGGTWRAPGRPRSTATPLALR